MRVLISGGGTGGHVYPALAVVEALRNAAPRPSHLEAATPVPATNAETDADVLYVGERNSTEEQLVTHAGLPFAPVRSGQVKRQPPWIVVRSLWRVWRGTRDAAGIVRKFAPDVCLVTGGYVCVPVVWACWCSGVPVLIYLPDITPGMAVHRLSRFADKVAVTVEDAAQFFPGKAVVTGYPVRAALYQAEREEAQKHFNLNPELPVVLCFGGSRGARSINQALTTVLATLLVDAQVIHVTGSLDWPWVQEAAAELPASLRERYRPFEYLHDEMFLALAAADLVIARAGASCLGEFPARGLPAILAPYPHSGRHQEANARHMVKRGAAMMIDDARINEELLPAVQRLLQDPMERARMALSSARLALPQAAAAIAQELRNLAATRRARR